MDSAHEVDRLLGSFVAGRLPFERLLATLRSLAMGEGAGPIADRLAAWRDAGRLPSDLAALLSSDLVGQSPQATEEDEDDDEDDLDPPTVPLGAGAAAAAGTMRDTVDDVVVDALIGGFKGLRDRARRPAETREDAALDASLAQFRSLRFRRDAGNAEAGRSRHFELDPRRERRASGVGTMLRDRFILDAEIARGGMGTVFRAVDRRRLEAMHRQPYVAVKLLNEALRHFPEALRTIEAEARRAQELAHPNIVSVYDFDRDGGHPFIVMELLEGRSVEAVLREGLPSRSLAAAILEGLCAGLAHAHRAGVVHADVKPSNVFLTQAGVVKLLDFGIASAARDGGFDAASRGGMTLPYASPQMAEGDERRPDDDVYALGCIAYELHAGRHPFDGLPARDARDRGLVPRRPDDVPDGVWSAIAAALRFDRAARPADAADFHRRFVGE